MKTYQFHDPDSKSTSDTRRKQLRLQIPEDLSGKRVLDIGCNEGYFCGLARERGAREVIGIDFVGSNIEFAEKHYGGDQVSFLRQTWSHLPSGPFDLVLWTSAMHYELDPRSVIEAIFERLTPDGLFILECGVAPWAGKTFLPRPRVADTRWYPSLSFLIDQVLNGFSVRKVAEGEIAEGDHVPRSVFHCKKALPQVVLVRGPSGDGKSSLADRLKPSATKLITLDMLVSILGTNKHPHSEFERFCVASYDPQNLGVLYSGIDDAGFTKTYAELLAEAVSKTDAMVIFEGHMTDPQAEELIRQLSVRALVWDLRRARVA